MSRLYCIKIVAAFVTAIAVVAAFNYSVDPYRAFKRKDITTSSDLIYYFRQIKAEQLRKASADLLILGSSRVAVIRPTLTDGEGYNAALPGMTSYEMLQTLRHANTFNATHQLMVGLDFSAYLDIHPKYRFGFSDKRMINGFTLPPDWEAIKQRLRDLYQLLLSVQVGIASLHNVLDLKPAQLNFRHDGTWRTNSAARNVPRKHKFFKIGKQYYDLAQKSSTQHDLQYLAELIRFCYAQGIDLHLFISPVHATTLAAYREAGQLEHMLRWQRNILDVLDAQSRHAGEPAFPLFGLQTAAATAESIEQVQGNPFFIDGVHYSPYFGELIRDTVLSQIQHDATQLTGENLGHYWSQSLLLLTHFERDNPHVTRDFIRKLRSND